ncbi:MAG: prephenate dehydratase [Bdellovibrio sp.]
MKIGFQGTRGAYSEEAIYKIFGKEVTPVGYLLSEEVAEALSRGEVDKAVLPVENSIAGNVAVNMDLLFQHDFYAYQECYLPIRHCLLALPGADIKNIKRVHSHPIALSQCRPFLREHNMIPTADRDTAGSCQMIVESQDPTQGAIASKLCAEYYGLQILRENIQSQQNNITRFLALSREKIKIEDANKTSLAFSTEHRAGALLEILGLFKNHSLNLTRLESRPIPNNPFQYIFFVDVQADLNSKEMQMCLQDILSGGHLVKILGSYHSGKASLDT